MTLLLLLGARSASSTPVVPARTSAAIRGLSLAGELPLGGVTITEVRATYFTVPLSIAFQTPDATPTSLSASGRITFVNGSSGALAVDGHPRITAVR